MAQGDRKRTDRHHALPSSSFPQFRNEPWNIRLVSRRRHVSYHALFTNRSPIEAAIILLYEFAPLDLEHWLHDPALPALIDLVERLKAIKRKKEREK